MIVVKRLFWMGVGAAAGASGTVWAQQKVKRQLEALGPDSVVAGRRCVASAAGSRTKAVGRPSVVDAASEGRSTMREREDELKDRPRQPPTAGPDAARARDRRPTDSRSSIRAARR